MNPGPLPPVRRRVLLVDDHVLLRESVADAVNRSADLVVCGQAATVDAALQRFDQVNPEIVVTDLSMPQLTGFSLIEQLCRRIPSVPVLVLSMHSETFHAPKTFRAGAAGYVMKGDSQRLLAGIRQVLAGGIYLSDHAREEILRQLEAPRGNGSQPPFTSLNAEEKTVFGLRGRGLKTAAIAEALQSEGERIEKLEDGIAHKLRLANHAAYLHHAILWHGAGSAGKC